MEIRKGNCYKVKTESGEYFTFVITDIHLEYNGSEMISILLCDFQSTTPPSIEELPKLHHFKLIDENKDGTQRIQTYDIWKSDFVRMKNEIVGSLALNSESFENVSFGPVGPALENRFDKILRENQRMIEAESGQAKLVLNSVGSILKNNG